MIGSFPGLTFRFTLYSPAMDQPDWKVVETFRDRSLDGTPPNRAARRS